MTPRNTLRTLACACVFLSLLCAATAAIPSPERLLPEDTLVMITAPDFAKLNTALKQQPQSQLWNDPAMKPFKDKFIAKWDEDLVKPIERELGVKFADYTSLPQGQVTFAITQNGWKGQDDQEPGLLLLVDTRDKSDQLKKNLADLKKKWVDSGKSLKSEKIRGLDFVVVSLSSNDVPKALRKLIPKSSEVQELGDEKQAKKAAAKDEFIIGQADSLLVVGSSVPAVETIIARLKGGSAPNLADFGPYQANHLALFRDASLYGWVNVKRFMDILVPIWSEKKENPDAPNPFDIAPDKILNALGLTALRTVAFSMQQSGEGSLFQVFCSVPEASRQGLFKILAGEPKEASPPPFVPADVATFQRWRMDGRKAWATLEKALSDISPQAISTLNFLLDSANTYGKEKDPGFDLRKNLIGNLGDDIISYQKPLRSTTTADQALPQSLYLLGSPNPEQVVGALKGILVFLSQQSGSSPQEREFLGRKIISVPLAIPGRPAPASGKTPTLSYAATSGYVALSTDATLIEEYLRSGDSQAKALRDLPGLTEAVQRVAAPGSSLFGYQNDAENMRAAFDMLRKLSASPSEGGSSGSLLPMAVGLGGGEKALKEWLDFSLLPPYDKISKYFGFSVYAGGATVDGLGLKMFAPVPAGLKR
jgi:hypothetical protein